MTGDLAQRTREPAGVTAAILTADGTRICYHQDRQGDEIGHCVSIPYEGGEPVDLTPELPPYASMGIYQSRGGKATGFVAADREGFHVYLMVDGNAARSLWHGPDLVLGPMLSTDGRCVAFSTCAHPGTLDQKLVAIDVAGGDVTAVLSPDAGHSLGLGAFSPVEGDTRLLATSNVTGTVRPFVWDPASGERTEVDLPGYAGDVMPWAWSPDGERILLNQLHQARYQLLLHDLRSGRTKRVAHPSGVHGGMVINYRFSYASLGDGDQIVTTWESPAVPPCLVRLGGAAVGSFEILLRAGEVPPGRDWESIEYTTDDGARIQGWLAVPEGQGPFPTILHTHGGPTTVMAELYSPESQAWLDHGVAYLSINYRGSTTFGREFERCIWGALGGLEVEDMVAAHRWLVDEGIAAPEAVIPTGGSYGGYLTLQALGKRPDLWAAGIARIAIADWRLMYEDGSEMIRGYQRAFFGGPPEAFPEAAAESSPITHAHDIAAPVLVIQGRNDSRCPARQMRAFEERMLELGKDIRVHWFDAGHGSRVKEQQVEFQELMLRFVWEVLREGGSRRSRP